MPTTASAASSGCTTIEAAGEPHDCLEVHYAGGDKLYLPVENIEMLTRYGSDESGVQLDRLGGVGWQTRKARLKQRIRDMAEKLIKVAALRELRQAPVLNPPDGRLRRVLGALPLRGDRRPGGQHRRRARRSRQRQADGPADLRRCRLRQDRGGVAREPSSPCWPASRWPWWCRPRCSRASTPTPSPSASADFPVKIAQASRLVGPQGARRGEGRASSRRRHRHRHRHPRSARQGASSSPISAC